MGGGRIETAPPYTQAEYRRKMRDRFAVAVLGSGLMGKLDPGDAVKAMFDIAEQVMEESQKRYERDRQQENRRRASQSKTDGA